MFRRINMKKVVLWLAAIMICSFTIAGLLSLILGPGEKTSDLGNTSTTPIDLEKSFNVLGVKDIEIYTVSESINIIPSDTSEIKAHFYGNTYNLNNAPELIAAQNGSTVEIKIKHKISVGINLAHSGLKLDVYIPKTYADNLAFETVSAEAEIKDFNLDTFKYHSVSGDLSALNVNTKETDLKTTSGKLKMDNFTGNLDFNSVSGAMDIKYSNFSHNIAAKTTSGDLNVKLPEKSEFSVNFKSTSGNFNSQIPITSSGSSSGKRHFKGSVGQSNNKIEVTSVSGDFEITK